MISSSEKSEEALPPLPPNPKKTPHNIISRAARDCQRRGSTVAGTAGSGQLLGGGPAGGCKGRLGVDLRVPVGHILCISVRLRRGLTMPIQIELVSSNHSPDESGSSSVFHSFASFLQHREERRLCSRLTLAVFGAVYVNIAW